MKVVRAKDMPILIARHNADDWRERDIARAMSDLGISNDPAGFDPKIVVQKRVGLSDVSTVDALPPVFDEAASRRHGSTEQVGAKRRILETRRHESAESGDDEDDELGHVSVRTRSPKSRPKSMSKLGIEMMRTNSRGSVISIDDVSVPDSALPLSPPPMITEDQAAEEREGKFAPAALPPGALHTPPEVFPAVPGDAVAEFVMTPRALVQSEACSPDPDPTPRPSSQR